MKRTILGLVVSTAALTSAVSILSAAGCSSTERPRYGATLVPSDAGTSQPSAASDASASRTRPSTRDAGDDTSCLAKEPIDATKIPYKKAGVTKGACTPEEADAITAYFKAHANDEDFTVSAWSKEVGAACARCAFSDGSGPTWTPILAKNDQIDTVDRGGCVEVLSGKEACGRAYQQVNECALSACLPASEGGEGTCKGQKPFIECLDDRDAIFELPCKDAYASVTQECGGALGDYEKRCEGRYTFEGPLEVMCVTGGAE